MGRNGHHPDLPTLEKTYFLEFFGERSIVNVFHVGGKLQQSDFLDGGNVEQSVIGNGVGHHHHSAAVELAVSNGKAHDLVVKNQLIVHFDLDMLAFERQDAIGSADQVTDGASLALRLQAVGLVAYHFVQTGSRGVQEITHPGIAVVVVGHLSDIMKENMSLFEHFDQLGITLGKVEGAAPVVASTNGDNSHSDFGGGKAVLGENAVDHLVVSAVTANGNDFFVSFF